MRQAAFLLACALLLTGCASAPRSSHPLADTLAGMPTTTFESIGFEDGNLVFRADRRTRESRGRSYRAEWEAFLIAEAVAERQRRAGEDTVRSVKFTGHHPYLQEQGITFRGFDGPEYHGARPTPPGLWEDADLVIKQQVRRTLAAYGLTSIRVAVLRPLGPAVAVRAVVPRGKPGWDIDDMFVAAFNQGWDGGYLELDSPRGRPLVRTETHQRLREGGVWFAPGQDKRFGIIHL